MRSRTADRRGGLEQADRPAWRSASRPSRATAPRLCARRARGQTWSSPDLVAQSCRRSW